MLLSDGGKTLLQEESSIRGTGSACSISSLNWPFEHSDFSSDRNLLTAWDLDSPSGLDLGFLGKGTMNRPSSVRVWVSLKCWITERSSEDRLDESQNCLSKSLPDVVRNNCDMSGGMRVNACESIFPAKSNMVSKAAGDPGGPDRRPCCIASV